MKNLSNISFKFILPAALVTLGILYLVLFAGFVDGLLNPILLTLLAAAWLFLGQKGKLPLEKPILGILFILIVTSLTSIDPRRSFAEILPIATGFFLYFCFSEISRRWIPAAFFINLVLMTGLGLMLFSWADALRWYLQWLQTSPGQWIPGISFRLNGSNLMAAFYNLVLMLAAARFIFTKSKIARFAWAFYGLSAAVLLFLTSSRGAWFGAAAGGLVLIYLSRTLIKATIGGIWRKFRHPRLVIALGCFVSLLALGFIGWIYFRLFALHPTHGAFLSSRGYIWNPAWQGFLHSPVWGMGPNTYASLLMRTISIPPAEIYVHAHNMYLDILEGSGLLGLISFGWLVFSVAKTIRGRLFEASENERSLIIGSAAALTAYCIHGIFDGVYLMTFATSTMIIILGVSLSSKDSRPASRRQVPIFFGLGLSVLIWTNLWLANPLIRGIQSYEAGNVPSAVQYLNQAVQRDSHLAVPHQQLGLVYSVHAAGADSTSLPLAINSFQEAINLDPDWSLNHANLAALYREQGYLELAIEGFQKAVKVSPGVPVFSLNLAQTLEMANQPVDAEKAYIQTLNLRPDWAESYFFRSTPLRRLALSTWRSANPPQSAAAIGVSVRGYAIEILRPVESLLEGNQVAEATHLLQLAGLAYFGSNEERLEFTWLQAALEAKKGNLSQAVQLGEKALDGYRKQGAYGPGSYGQTPYASLLFHSYSLKDDFVPQLTLITLTDHWGQREYQLSTWYRQLGNSKRSDQRLFELKKAIPDFSPSE